MNILFCHKHHIFTSSQWLGTSRARLAKCFIVLLLMLVPVIQSSAYGNTAESREYQAKALFLYNFANFVEWPKEAFSLNSDPIRMCLFGDIPFSVFLDTVNGTLIGDRPLNIQRASKLKDIETGCHILFVGDEQRVLLPEFWRQIKYLYVLSVGEQTEFTKRGGIINILRTTDRVQFDVNISNAIANGLFISSDLLALARTIRENTQVRP